MSKYINKYNKKILIQTKSYFNEAEKLFIEKLFYGCRYKISWRDTENMNRVNFNAYKSISSSELVIGAPSTLLREAIMYPNTKIVCFDPTIKFGKLCLLHFDAHADLRSSYNGNKFSHASAIRRCLDDQKVNVISFGIRNISKVK